jgi:hypothetical protein
MADVAISIDVSCGRPVKVLKVSAFVIDANHLWTNEERVLPVSASHNLSTSQSVCSHNGPHNHST